MCDAHFFFLIPLFLASSDEMTKCSPAPLLLEHDTPARPPGAVAPQDITPSPGLCAGPMMQTADQPKGHQGPNLLHFKEAWLSYHASKTRRQTEMPLHALPCCVQCCTWASTGGGAACQLPDQPLPCTPRKIGWTQIGHNSQPSPSATGLQPRLLRPCCHWPAAAGSGCAGSCSPPQGPSR